MTGSSWPSASPVFGDGEPGWRLFLEVRPAKGRLTVRQQRRLITALSGDWDGPDDADIGADGLPPFLWRKPLFDEEKIVEWLLDVGVRLRYRCAWIGSATYYSLDGPDWTVALEDREWHEVDGRV